MLGLNLSLMMQRPGDSGSVTITITAADAADGAIIVATSSFSGGSLLLDIDAPAAYASEEPYVVALADLEAGPVNLVAPTSAGTTGTGDVITAVPGLWVSLGALSVVTAWVSNIDGTVLQDNSAPYTVTATDVEAGVNLRETATDARESRVATGIAVVENPVWTPIKLFLTGRDGVWIDPEAGGAFTDAGKTTAATDTDAIAALADLSGNGYDFAQATSGARPLYIASGINSLAVARFDGVDDTMATAASMPFMTGQAVCHQIFAVHVSDTSIGANHALGWSGTTGGGGYRNSGFRTSIEAAAIAGGGDVRAAVDLTAPIIYEVVWGTNQIKLAINGSAFATVSASGSGAATPYRLSDSLFANRLQYDLAALVMTDGELSTADRAKALAYCAGKLGITI